MNTIIKNLSLSFIIIVVLQTTTLANKPNRAVNTISPKPSIDQQIDNNPLYWLWYSWGMAGTL